MNAQREVNLLRYLGSKTLLLEQINKLVGPQPTGSVFCDPFGGIGTVGSYMKRNGFQVISGDVLQFAHYFQRAIVQLDGVPLFLGITHETGVDVELYMNQLSNSQGWFVEAYSEKRSYFTKENACKIQGCINAIWKWRENQSINEDEYAFLIASLIQSMDRVANTAGTYYAYLKQFYRKALQPFSFRFLSPVKGMCQCRSMLKDANELVRQQKCQILYLDPPYNTRDYSRYYHLPESIARGEIPVPTGKSGVPQSKGTRSPYIQRVSAETAFAELLKSCRCEMLLFHYTDNGLLSTEFIREHLSELGEIHEYYFDCKGYRTSESSSCGSQHHVYKVMI